jgi:GAF domain-containing protein
VRVRQDEGGTGFSDDPEFSDRAVRFLAILARALRVRNAELQPTLDAIVSTAVTILAPACYAGLITVQDGELVPQSTLGRPPEVLDLLQQRLRTGPCQDAAERQQTVRIDDTGGSGRWPEFMAAAAALGVRSLLCVPLRVDERCLGTLSLYAERTAAFTDNDERVAALLATLAALALAEAQHAEQMRAALTNRDLIGQAKGILMERGHLDAGTAFRHLSRVSQDSNIKLLAVARQLVETGELPGAPVRRAPVLPPGGRRGGTPAAGSA